VTDAAPLSVTLDVTAVPRKPAGAGRYTIELARALAERDDVSLTAIARRNDVTRWQKMAAETAFDVVAAAPGPRPMRLAWEQLGLPRLLAKLDPAVHHGPHYTMPERSTTPVVVTIHDCTFFDHPEWHERSKVVVFRRAIARAAARAQAIVCVSQTTAERLRSVCTVTAPVFVAPHGVDHERFVPTEPSRGADRDALGRFGLNDRPYVLFVGTIEPRKGVATLVRAFDQVAGRHPDALLVVAGQPGWGGSDVEQALDGATQRDRIRLLGYVPDLVVPALLRSAAAVAYPALEEGYGLPALEALACGAPLITTTGTAMAEFAHGAAVLVSPGSVGELADALDAVLDGTDQAERAERRAKGIALALERTWATSAALHCTAYRAAAARS
jgi:glycosyltransferase involved in cell wall biosynthesis